MSNGSKPRGKKAKGTSAHGAWSQSGEGALRRRRKARHAERDALEQFSAASGHGAVRRSHHPNARKAWSK